MKRQLMTSRQRALLSAAFATSALTAAAVVYIFPNPVFAATKTIAAPNLVVAGQVVSGRANYGDNGNAGNSKPTLSSVSAVASAYSELLWIPSWTKDGSDFKSGDKIPIKVVGRAMTDSAGRYAISAVPSVEMLAAAKLNDGWINFTLTTYSGADYVVEAISRHWDGMAWTDYGADRPSMSPTSKHQTLFATDVRTGEHKFGTNAAIAGRVNTARMATGSAVAAGCTYVPYYYTNNWSTIIEFHNNAVADGHWEYGATADSDIEAGISYDGAHGGGAGTIHLGNSAFAKLGFNISTTYGKYAQSSFRYEWGSMTCGAGAWWSYVRASRWNGSGLQTPDNSPFNCSQGNQAAHKLWQPKGSTFARSSSRSFRYGTNVSILGYSLGITSGYSSWVDMSWNFLRGGAYLCGNNDFPAYSQIVYTS